MNTHYMNLFRNLSYCLLLLFCFNQTVLAKDVWRIWTEEDGLESAITKRVVVDGENGVWILQSGNMLSWFDGYFFQTVPKYMDEYFFIPAFNTSGIIFDKYGPAGQFQGFKLFHQGVWKVLNPMPRENWGGISFWNVRGFPLTNEAILLCGELGLVQVNLLTHQIQMIRSHDEINLGNVISEYQNKSNGIWIFYEKGLCHITENPMTPLNPNINIFRLPEFVLQNYSFEFSNPSSQWIEQMDQDLFIKVWDIRKNCFNTLHFDGIQWEEMTAYQYPERAWPNANGYCWGYNDNKLREFSNKYIQDWIFRDVTINDAAVKNEQEFFMATDQGLYYHHEPLWKIPSSLANFEATVEYIHEDDAGRIVFKTNQGLSIFDHEKMNHVDIHDASLEINLFLSGYINLFSNTYSIQQQTLYGWYNFRGISNKYFSYDPASNTLNHVVLKDVFTMPDHTGFSYLLSKIHSSNSSIPALLEFKNLNDYQDTLISVYDITNQPPKLMYTLPDTPEFQAVSNRLEHNYFYQTSGQTIWTSGLNSILSFDKNQNLHVYEMAHARIKCFIETGDGMFWAGTNQGIIQFENDNWVPVEYDTGDVNCMIKTKDQSVWIASNTGVHRYKNGAWVSYFIEHGLPNNFVSWLYQDQTERIWAGTSRGVCYFNAGIDTDPPVLFISDEINKHQKMITPGADVRIEFGGLDRWNYTREKDLQYSYRINRGEWSPFTLSNVYQTSNAKTGNYTMDVRCMDMSFNISPQIRSFEFSVLLPWYQTHLFISFAVFSGIIILFLFTLAVHNHFLLKESFQKLVQSDEMLVRINSELEQRVLERTTELEQLNSDLHQKNMERNQLITELEKQQEEMERFTYTVSHDLKSPLITIRSFAGFVQKELKPLNLNKAVEDVNRIQSAAERMQSLLDELLTLSRIGRIDNHMIPVHFGNVVNEVLVVLDGPIQMSKAQIRIETKLPTINIDKPRIMEALQNLIENAIKYSKDSQIPHIAIGMEKENGNQIFYVKDDGIGIEKAHHEKIFNMFEQLDKTREGSGMGLAIVKRIIELHHGRIWVESEGWGKGSKFCFTLST